MYLTHFLLLLPPPQVRACISDGVVIKSGNLQQLLVFRGVSTKVELVACFPLSCQNYSSLLYRDCTVRLSTKSR